MAGLLVIGLCGCVIGGASTRVDPSPAEDLPILREKSGTYSRLAQPVRILARDRATLALVPLTDLQVNFDTEMVLIAGLGPTVSDELGIRIARVWREGSRIRVQERQIHPGLDHATGLHPASPWTMVVVPKSDLNVEGYSAKVPKDLLSDHPGAR